MSAAPQAGVEGLASAAAVAHLANRSPVLARALEDLGRPEPVPRRASGFETVARIITFQQLAGSAAAAIWRRVRALVDGPFNAEGVLALTPGELRACGLSNAKVRSLEDLAVKATDGTIRFRGLSRLDEVAVADQLTQVRGVGPWTVHMFCLNHLRRPDVWPTGDLGVRQGWALIHGMTEPPPPDELAAAGEPLRPHRGTAALLCWKAADARPPR